MMYLPYIVFTFYKISDRNIFITRGAIKATQMIIIIENIQQFFVVLFDDIHPLAVILCMTSKNFSIHRSFCLNKKYIFIHTRARLRLNTHTIKIIKTKSIIHIMFWIMSHFFPNIIIIIIFFLRQRISKLNSSKYMSDTHTHIQAPTAKPKHRIVFMLLAYIFQEEKPRKNFDISTAIYSIEYG